MLIRFTRAPSLLGTVGGMRTRDLPRDTVWFDLALASAILVVTLVLLALVAR